MITYEQAKHDDNRLDEIIECGDTIMFAADEVFDLMADPTKKRAKDMYVRGITQWFEERRLENYELPFDVLDFESDIHSIADVYGMEWNYYCD